MQEQIDRWEYGPKLVGHIMRRVKRVRGWIVNIECMTGAIYLAHPEVPFVIYATPLWEDTAHDLDIQLDDNNGEFDCFAIPVAWTGEPEIDCARWVHIVATVIGTVKAARTLFAA